MSFSRAAGVARRREKNERREPREKAPRDRAQTEEGANAAQRGSVTESACEEKETASAEE